MSENLTLKPICLPFYADTQEWDFVLKTLSDSNSTTSISPNKKGYTSIINATLTNLIYKRPISIAAREKEVLKIKKILTSLGMQDFFIDAADLSNQSKTVLAKESITGHVPSDKELETDRSWWKLSDILKDYQSYINRLNKQIVGQKTLEHLIFEFFQDNDKTANYFLNGRIRNEQYDFSVKEYWHLRGRVKTGETLYRPMFKESFPLENLNPVFLDMYSPYEAQVLLEEKLKSFQDELNTIKLDLIKWTAFYRQSAIEKTKEAIRDFNQKMKKLRIRVRASLDIDTHDKKQTFLSRTFGNTSQVKAQKVKAIGEEYNGLIDQISKTLELSENHFDQWKENSDILFLIEDAMQRLKSKRKLLLAKIDHDIVKLNPHVAKTQLDGSGQLLNISKRLTDLFSELNKYQIFNTFWEDNTLDVLSRIAHFELWETEVENVLASLDSFKEFYQWKKFFDILGTPTKELINTLILSISDDWVSLFDSWYLYHLIGQQSIEVPLEQNLILPLFRDANRVNVDKVKQIWPDQMKANLEELLKENKSFKQWLDGKIPDISIETQKKFADVYPILFNTISDDESKVIERDVHIVLSEEEETKGHHLKISEENGGDLNFDLPLIPNGLLQSEHSERIQVIRQFAQFIIESLPPFNLYQSNKTAVLVFARSHYEELLVSSYKERFSVDEISELSHLEKLTEAMVDNTRQFHVIVQDKLSEKNQPQDILWDAVIKGLMEKAGITYHLVYSYNLFIHSNFISTCVDSVSLRADDNIPTKSEPPVLHPAIEDQEAELDI